MQTRILSSHPQDYPQDITRLTDRRKHVRLFSAMGFEHMTPEERRAASSKGGKTSGQSKKHNRFDTHTAKIAGRKGGAAHSPEHMAKLGRLGGSVPRIPRNERTSTKE
jgi:general stress protein YciG